MNIRLLTPMIAGAVVAAALWVAAAPVVAADQPHVGSHQHQHAARSPELRLSHGARIVYIGNTFTERLALFGNFEAIVHAARPDLDLTFRNVGWSADMLGLQPRPMNFGTMDEHLTRQKADVILACFGMNESFAGPAGLEQFKSDWRRFLAHALHHPYNGKNPPQIVIVSPIAHEDLGSPHLPDGTAHNKNLALYAEAMKQIAADHNLSFVDLFTPTRSLMSSSSRKLTINGIHPNLYGEWVIAQIMAEQLELIPPKQRVEIANANPGQLKIKVGPALPPPHEGGSVPEALREHQPTLVIKGLKPGRYELQAGGRKLMAATADQWNKGVLITDSIAHQQAEKLRETVVKKNWEFYHRYRAVNGFYIYGGRAKPFGVVSFPPEMEKSDQIIAGLDKQIHALAQPLPEQTYDLVRIGE